jgi:hypothetical protein
MLEIWVWEQNRKKENDKKKGYSPFKKKIKPEFESTILSTWWQKIMGDLLLGARLLIGKVIYIMTNSLPPFFFFVGSNEFPW